MTAGRVLCLLLALGLGPALGPGAAAAQLGIVRSGLAGGTSTPVGAFAGVAEEGVNALGMLAIEIPFLPLGVRGDLMYQHHPGVDGGHFRQLAGTASAKLRFPLGILSPYLLGGIGFYLQRRPGDALTDAGTAAQVGYAGGLGVQLAIPLLSPFVEVRYHTVPGQAGVGRTLPISVGLMF